MGMEVKARMTLHIISSYYVQTQHKLLDAFLQISTQHELYCSKTQNYNILKSKETKATNEDSKKVF